MARRSDTNSTTSTPDVNHGDSIVNKTATVTFDTNTAYAVRPDLVSTAELQNVGKELGRIVYNTDTNQMLYWNGTEWREAQGSVPTNVSAFTNDAGYLTSETDSQTLNFDDSTRELEISNGNTVVIPDTTYTNVSEFVNDAGYLTSETDSQTLSVNGTELSISNGNTVQTQDTTYENLSEFNNDVGYITSFTDTQLTNEQVQDIVGAMFSGNVENNITVVYDDTTGVINFNAVDTNTQRTDAEIQAIIDQNTAGFLTVETDSQTLTFNNGELSISNGNTVTIPDTQYSNVSEFTNDAGYITSADVPTNVSELTNDAGYITSYTDTQRTDQEIQDIIDDNTNGFITDGNQGWNNEYGFITSADVPTNVSELANDAGYITSYVDTQRSDEEIRDVANAQWISGTNTTVVVDDANNTIQINAVDTNTQRTDQEIKDVIATEGYIKTETDNQTLTITGDQISISGGNTVTIPNVTTYENVSEFTNDAGYITAASIPTNVSAFTNDAGYLTSYTDTTRTDAEIEAIVESYNYNTSYTHQQPTASATWTITHNMGRFPSISVVDSAGSIVNGVEQYTSNNELTITFNAAFSGTAYLN